MPDRKRLRDFRVVRLNAELLPISPLEAELYRQCGIDPIEVGEGTADELRPHVADADALMVASAALPEELIQSLSHCRLISRLGNGTDKIHIPTATSKGIIVSNAPYFCVSEMADHAMAMLLSLARKLPQMSRYMYLGDYKRAREGSCRIRRLEGQVLGLIGFGATGQALARRAKAAGMQVIATRKNMQARKEAIEIGVELVDLDRVLTESDFVSLHLPLSAETYRLLDEAALRKMKRGAYLINTSRGAIVDEQALAAALRDGHLAGAGLDTFHEIAIFEENPAPPDHPLTKLDNVILTPHVSGLSEQAMEDVARTGVQNLISVLSGHWPHPENVVNRGVQPWFPLEPYDPSLFERIAT